MSYPFYPLPLAPTIFLLGLPQSLLKSWPLLLRLLSTTDAYTQGCINTTCWVYLRGREFRADPLELADLSGVLSLESTVYTSLFSHSLPVALHGGAGIMGFPPSTWASWLLTLCGPCLGDHCWYFFTGAASLLYTQDTVSAATLVLRLSLPPAPSSSVLPEP